MMPKLVLWRGAATTHGGKSSSSLICHQPKKVASLPLKKVDTSRMRNTITAGIKLMSPDMHQGSKTVPVLEQIG
jgi:hypothetical protein